MTERPEPLIVGGPSGWGWFQRFELDTHTEKSNRAGEVEKLQHVQCPSLDLGNVGGRRWTGADVRLGEVRGVPDLDCHPDDAAAVGDHLVRKLAGHLDDSVLDLLPAGEVMGVGGLPAA